VARDLGHINHSAGAEAWSSQGWKVIPRAAENLASSLPVRAELGAKLLGRFSQSYCGCNLDPSACRGKQRGLNDVVWKRKRPREAEGRSNK
jgi:hypothetical protein